MKWEEDKLKNIIFLLQRYYNGKKDNEILAVIEALDVIDPDNFLFLGISAFILFRMNDSHNAITKYFKSTTVTKKSQNGNISDKYSSFSIKSYISQISNFVQKLSHEEKSVFVFYIEGLLFNYENDHINATKSFDNAISLEPGSAWLWNMKAEALLQCKRFPETIIACENACRYFTNNALAWNIKGNALLKMKQYDEALIAFECSISIDAKFPHPRINKCHTLILAGRKEEAFLSIQEIKKILQPDSKYYKYFSSIEADISANKNTPEFLKDEVKLNQPEIQKQEKSDPLRTALKMECLTLLRTALNSQEAQFRDNQWEIIESLIENKAHLLVVQRTGWGKSFIYFIATQILRKRGSGPSIIISPLIALMRNQIQGAERIGLHSRTIHSGNNAEWDIIYEELEQGLIDLLIVSPERLSNDEFREKHLLPVAQTIGLFVIDEAHCISEWGHDFRPDYQRILKILQFLPKKLSSRAGYGNVFMG